MANPVANLQRTAAEYKQMDAKDKRRFITDSILNNALYILMLAFCIYTAIQRPNFLSAGSLGNLIVQVAAYLPMALGMLCASALEYFIRTRRFWRPAGLAALCMGTALCCARALGVIMPNSGSISRDYGTFSMNLNALFNPRSMDLYVPGEKLDWSVFLPLLPQI